jgi:N-acetylglutamate synthase-like GNAT family acetyltransferase
VITYEYLNPDDYRSPTGITPKSGRDIQNINRLWNQLSTRPRTIDAETVTLVVMLAHVLVARDEDDRTQAMATLGVLPTLHGTIGLVEDVVVDESLRGHHVGEGLMTRIIELAKNSEVNQLELSSKPARVAANRLYQKLGFQLRPDDTNHYTLPL